MLQHFQNYVEQTFVMGMILFIDPFELTGIIKLLAGAFVVFIGRISYEVFLTRPFTRVMRHVKKKLMSKDLRSDQNKKD